MSCEKSLAESGCMRPSESNSSGMRRRPRDAQLPIGPDMRLVETLQDRHRAGSADGSGAPKGQGESEGSRDNERRHRK